MDSTRACAHGTSVKIAAATAAVRRSTMLTDEVSSSERWSIAYVRKIDGRKRLVHLTLSARECSSRADRPASAALLQRGDVALRFPHVELARAADLHLRVGDHLDPVRDPADRATDGEHHREHVERDAERLVDDAGVEIDVRIELALDEELVPEGDLLQPHRELHARVAAVLCEHLVRDTLDDARARVVGVIDAVAEAFEAPGI